MFGVMPNDSPVFVIAETTSNKIKSNANGSIVEMIMVDNKINNKKLIAMTKARSTTLLLTVVLNIAVSSCDLITDIIFATNTDTVVNLIPPAALDEAPPIYIRTNMIKIAGSVRFAMSKVANPPFRVVTDKKIEFVILSNVFKCLNA